MRFILFALLSSLIILASCEGKDEGIPVYIQIDTAEVIIKNPNKEGSNNHSITDVWVYINGIYQGNYEIPAKFPVLNTGNQKITLKAGIKLNGISATREAYTFYNFIDIDTLLTEAKTIKLEAKFPYIDNANFWIEDFNDGDIKIGTTPQTLTDTSIQQIPDPNNPLEFYGGIFVDAVRPNFIGATNTETDPIYYHDADRRLVLEMQYKSNQYLHIGLLTEAKRLDVMTLFPSPEWQTIYIDLTPTIKLNPYEKYSLAFWTLYNGEYNGEIFLNNVKLVNYE